MLTVCIDERTDMTLRQRPVRMSAILVICGSVDRKPRDPSFGSCLKLGRIPHTNDRRLVVRDKQSGQRIRLTVFIEALGNDTERKRRRSPLFPGFRVLSTLDQHAETSDSLLSVSRVKWPSHGDFAGGCQGYRRSFVSPSALQLDMLSR